MTPQERAFSATMALEQRIEWFGRTLRSADLIETGAVPQTGT